MRKGLRALASCLLALTLTGCARSNRDYYERAQLYLGSGDCGTAALLFSQLGEYEDSAEYALYCAGLDALRRGDLPLARANLQEVDPFKSSPRYLRYIDAQELEAMDDLSAALDIYASLGSFNGSDTHAEKLRAAIPEKQMQYARSLLSAGHPEQAVDILSALDGYADSAALIALCEQAITQGTYDRAQQLYQSGDYEAALSAFESLGDTLDARARALNCRSAMYQALEERYQQVTLETAASLLEAYQEMEDYLDSPARVAALEERYHVNLALADSASQHPYAVFGRYPYGESGLDAPLTWQVLKVEDGTATLLCTAVIDAQPAATPTDLMLSPEEEAAKPDVSLPAQSDIALLPPSLHACPATPYAIAQGVRHHSDGRAWWWLSDTTPAGRQLIMWYSGEMLPTGISPEESVVGVRPLLTLSLNRYAFTAGDGSAENPFR